LIQFKNLSFYHKSYNYSRMKKFIIGAFFLASASLTPLHAQLLSVNNSNSNDKTEVNDNKLNWSVYTDNENHVVYIDFEKINLNLNGIVVKDGEGKVVFKDDALWQLPVNTIYEVDCSNYPKGEYLIELRTFTTVMRKAISVK
jgi:hypothetical protein